MPIRLLNSLTKKLEPFDPIEPGFVKMYVCGPTVYDDPHVGHLRSAYAFEVIRNYLAFSGYKVKFVRNVTDVDDKIIDRARKSGAADLNAATREVSERYLKAYADDLAKLGIQPPDVEPRATTHIGEMIALCERLIAGGKAYASGGDVYFDVRAFEAYGKLSHQNKEAMLQNVRVDKNEKKRDPLDFALWKQAKAGEPSWPSPWGDGRPGWHIECSAMSIKYLGETFDIHGGGRDLIFPHHENEVAQSEAATGKPFARYWIHHGLVTVNQVKMSKSLGNFIKLCDVSAKSSHAIEELKLLFLGTHYTAPLDYSEDRMKMESSVRERFDIFFDDVSRLTEPGEDAAAVAGHEASFREAMDDDFNTPQALAVMHEIVTAARKSGKAPVMRASASCLRKIGAVLGVFAPAPAATNGMDAEIETMIRERNDARKSRDFKRADEVRQRLTAKGIALKDLPDGGTAWRRT